MKNVVSALHWAHRFAQVLEEQRIAPYSVEISDKGSTFHLSYLDFLKFYTVNRWVRPPTVRAYRVGHGPFTLKSTFLLRFEHGTVSVATYTPATSAPVSDVPDEGLSLGQWDPSISPEPWVRGEQ